MILKYIKIQGFRKFENEFETRLYDITSISGGNAQGKTNILYAIIWAFLGTNITGDDKVWLGNKKTDDCYVELKFEDNQEREHTIVRYKNKYDNKKNILLLDGKKIDAEDLQSFYKDKKLFLSIINPNYFINKKPSEQKQLLDKYLPDLDMKVVYNKLEDKEKQKLEGVPKNITEYLKDLSDSKKMYEDKIKNLKGKIEYAESTISEKLEDTKTFEKDEELSLARQELSFLISEKDSPAKNKQQKIVDNINAQISQIEGQIKELSEKMNSGKATYLSIKNAPIAYCPTCKQKIEDASKLNTIFNMKKELEELFVKKTSLETSLRDLKSQFVTERCKLHSLEGNSNIEKQITDVEKQIERLEQELQEVQKYNNTIIVKQNNIKEAKQDIDKFKKQIREYEKQIDNTEKARKIAQKLFINYIEEKMQFATKYLKDVKIRYYSILKETGELKEDFIITYKGNELKNLSRSETIATSLEICNMLNKISKMNMPLFIDDSESCADYNFIEEYARENQVLISKVEKGKTLTIEKSNIQDEYLKVA